MFNRLILTIKQIGFRTPLILLLLGVTYGQYKQNKVLYDAKESIVSTLTSEHSLEMKLLELEYKQESDLLKQVIRKFSGDVKKDVKMLYEAQVNTATSYSNRVCETDSTPNITASNRFVADYTMAVSRDLEEMGFKMGTFAYVEELGIFVLIQDRMNRRFCKRVDFFNSDTGEAIQFGKKQLTVYLLDDIIL